MIISSVIIFSVVIAIGVFICTSDDGDYAASALAQMDSVPKRLAK